MVTSCATLSAGLHAHLKLTVVENTAPLTLMPPPGPALTLPTSVSPNLCHQMEMIDINTLQAQTGFGETYPGLQLANSEI